MEEFTNSTGAKLGYGFLAAFFLGFSIFFFNMYHAKAGYGVLLIPIFFMLFGLLTILNLVKRKVIISVDSIKSINAFGAKEILTSNVKGCRISEKVISIEPALPSSPKITISNYTSLGNSEDLVAWLNTNFPDLDAVDLKQEKDQLLNDTTLGATKEEREQKLSAAKQLSLGYNIGGMAFGFFLILINASVILSILMLIVPLAGVLIVVFSKGLINFVTDSRRSAHPNVALGCMLPTITSFIRSISGFEIYRHDNIWIPCIITALIIFFILYKKGIEAGKNINVQVVAMIFFTGAYAYGSTIRINCAFDNSNPQIIRTSVSDIDITHGKSTHYYVLLKSWDADPKPKKIEVSGSTFYRFRIGNEVNVNMKKGLLNIPWYYL